MSIRENMPSKRSGYTRKARVGGQKIYLTTGEMPDGRLGEIFLRAAKVGTLLQALLDSFAVAVSLGLQHGVPLEEYIEAFRHTKFEPCGPVSIDRNGSEPCYGDDIHMATSLLDYVFHEIELSYNRIDSGPHHSNGEDESTRDSSPDSGSPPEKVAGKFHLGSGV